MKRRICVLPVILVLAALFSGCSQDTQSGSAAGFGRSSDWDSMVQAAKKEGTVSVYASQGAAYRQMDVIAFEDAFPGVKVDAIFVSSNERMSRLSLERQAGKYLADVWISGTSDTVTTVKDAGFLQPLKPQLVLPEVLDESAWLQHRLWWADGAEPLTTLQFEGVVNPILFVNPKLVDPASFKSYWDLLDPKWKGKIVSSDIRTPGKGADSARFAYKNPALGPAFLTRMFSELDVKLSDDQRQLIDWIGQGTYPLGVFLAPSEVTGAMKQGLPLAIVPAEQLKEGASIGPGAGALAMVNRAPHPSAAQLYVNWLLSRQGQDAWQRIVGDPSLRVDVPKSGLNPQIVPRDGVSYTSTGTEEYGRLQSGVVRGLIDDALNKART
jgi:iron(III) transport system substrate-binding protein